MKYEVGQKVWVWSPPVMREATIIAVHDDDDSLDAYTVNLLGGINKLFLGWDIFSLPADAKRAIMTIESDIFTSKQQIEKIKAMIKNRCTNSEEGKCKQRSK